VIRLLITRLLKDQRGAGTLALALIGLMMATMLVTPFLSNLQTHLLAVGKTNIALTNSSSAQGAIEHALWRLQHEENFTDSLTPSSPSITYNITIESETVPITIARIFPEGYSDPLPPTTPNKGVKITKMVAPATVSGSVETTYSYTVILENTGNNKWDIKQVNDQLPLGLSYVPGSFGGIVTGDPVITTNNGQKFLQFTDDGNALLEDLLSGQTATLTFDAIGTLPIGIHFNHANADLTAGLKCRGTGPTAPITVVNGGLPGPPPPPSGIGMTVDVIVTPTVIDAFSSATVTYTVILENTGTDQLEIKEIYDLLPPHFSYVAGSYSGVPVKNDPKTSDVGNYQQQLKWGAAEIDDKWLDAGEINTFSFQAQANVIEGLYQNIAWVDVKNNELGCAVSGLTADVDVQGGYDVLVTAGNLVTKVHVSRSAIDATVSIDSWQIE